MRERVRRFAERPKQRVDTTSNTRNIPSLKSQISALLAGRLQMFKASGSDFVSMRPGDDGPGSRSFFVATIPFEG